MTSNLHHIIVPLSHGYMEYIEAKPFYSSAIGAMVHPSVYVRTVDYSDVCDACLDDLKELYL